MGRPPENMCSWGACCMPASPGVDARVMDTRWSEKKQGLRVQSPWQGEVTRAQCGLETGLCLHFRTAEH